MEQEMERWFPVIVNLVVAAFIYGGLFATVREHSKGIAALWKQSNTHAREIARLQGQAARQSALCEERHKE